MLFSLLKYIMKYLADVAIQASSICVAHNRGALYKQFLGSDVAPFISTPERKEIRVGCCCCR